MANGGIIGPPNTVTPAVSPVRTNQTTSGCVTLQPTTSEIEVVMIAGGGGGGVYAGAGAGAGGLLYYGPVSNAATAPEATGKARNGASLSVTGGSTIPITIGGGGAGSPGPGSGSSGSNTTLTIEGTPYTLTGGGYGGGSPGGAAPGGPGGSGGGGGGSGGGSKPGGSGICGQGFAGGTMPSNGPCGSGGGASQAGFAGAPTGSPFPPGTYGIGGAGAGYDIADGSTIVYYAGGGSGASTQPGTSCVTGGFGRTTAGPGAATANTGRGGGGAGGAGASGAVIIHEPGSPAVAPGIWSLNEVYENVKDGNWTNA
jgi:hypothetical protein